MMLRRKILLFSVFAFFVIHSGTVFSQSQVGIVLNEYSASNMSGQTDGFGAASDWLEIYNPNTFSLTLQSYYLSNDRENLLKWKFPDNYTLPAQGIKIIWLTGRNTLKNGDWHTNFTLEQCKNQWLILSTDAGVPRDSVFVQATMEGHSRGRVDVTTVGVSAWRLYTNPTFGLPNPNINNFLGYCPKPRMSVFPLPQTITDQKSNTGGFYDQGAAPQVYFKLENNLAYDSALSCFRIYYTTNGTFPQPGIPPTLLYGDSANASTGVLALQATTMIRAIAVPKPTILCDQRYLPSYCETNTYFLDAGQSEFSPEFGVVSLAMDPNWFQSNGVTSPSVHVEYYDKKRQVSEGYANVNRPIQEAWRTKQRGMYISLDDRRGFGCAIEGQVFNVDLLGTSTRTHFPVIHLKSGDIESNSVETGSGLGTTGGTGLRDVLIQSLAAKYDIKVNPLRIKPVIAFVNAKYYGVYDLREIYDKYYENYYNGQSMDSLTLAFYHNGDGAISYADGTSSDYNNDFDAKIYNEYITLGKPLRNASNYQKLMNELDKESFMDYFIVNSYALNSDLWNYNIAYAKGEQKNLPGGKWHYYLWNAPTVFNFTSVKTNTLAFDRPDVSPCAIYASASTATVSFLRGNSHAVLMNKLMDKNIGNVSFQLEYKNRYLDLLNGPLRCETVIKQLDDIQALYSKEMKYHSDPATGLQFGTVIEPSPFCWDSTVLKLRDRLVARCHFVSNSFTTAACYGMVGPHNIKVDIRPDSAAGRVKLNTEILKYYPWSGNYYTTTMGLKAIPSSTAYVFDHWEFLSPQNAETTNLKLDSIGYSFTMNEEVVAVFVDITKSIASDGDFANIPTGFTPNGDLLNDVFRPLGSAVYAMDYEMTVWNRWGEEVFRSTSPQQGWDGNYKGVQALTGVYAYVIKYKDPEGENKVYSGNVTLTR
jgi:gliding motility-associated-like protein